MKIFIFPNLNKANCEEYVIKACEVLLQNGCSVYIENKYKEQFDRLDGVTFDSYESCILLCDVVVAVGGDGTILNCAIDCAKNGKPVLGINCGRLGFMASLEHTQIELLKRLVDGDHTHSKRMLISVDITDEHGRIVSYCALNDVVLSKSDNCKIADFEVCRNEQIVSSLRADGIIFSTPTGASAYSMSAGGPIIEPDMECIEFTQICPHSLFARTMIFATNSIITAKCNTCDGAYANVVVDGNTVYKMTYTDIVTIKRADNYVDIIDIHGDSFFTSVNKKLMQPLKELSGGDLK